MHLASSMHVAELPTTLPCDGDSDGGRGLRRQCAEEHRAQIQTSVLIVGGVTKNPAKPHFWAD
jgi:hypothetical protein